MNTETVENIGMETYQGGVEQDLSWVGWVLFCLGLVGGGLGFYYGCGHGEFKWLPCVLGASSIIMGIVVLVIFLAVAEIIRLMKKANQIPFSGAISQARLTK